MSQPQSQPQQQQGQGQQNQNEQQNRQQLSINNALDTLCTMFESVDRDVIHMILIEGCGGNMESAVEALLTMTGGVSQQAPQQQQQQPQPPQQPKKAQPRQQQQQQQQQQQPFQAIQKLQRPRTARRAPPKLKSNVIDEQKQNEVKNNIIIMDNNDNSNNNTFENDDIDDIDDLDELEQNMNNDLRINLDGMNEQQVDDGNHGKLVRDILDAQSGIKIDTTMRLGTHRKDSAKSVEKIENMREMIQKLCQTCLPLGKCIDLVFEDVESINNQLFKWKQEIIKNKAKLVQEREKTNKILNPLQQQIENIQQEIQNQHQLILEKKAVLLRNETKTNDIIRKRLLNE